MARFLNFITKANQVLLFFALLAAIGMIGFGIYSSRSRAFQPPQVQVAPPDAASTVTEIRDISFLGRYEGSYVFGVMKKAVSGEATDTGAAKLAMISSRYEPDDGQIVNVIYSREGKIVKTLLPRDGLVLRSSFPNHYERQEFTAHVFTCITEDTNRDKVLNGTDRHDVIIVDPLLQRPDIVVRDALDTSIISSTEILVKVHTPDSLRFVKVDTDTGTQTDIAWK